MIKASILIAIALVLSACVLFEKKEPPARHDPVRTLCGSIGLMTWRQADTEETKKNIKVHNAIRRTLCPPDRYPEWYYGETASAGL